MLASPRVVFRVTNVSTTARALMIEENPIAGVRAIALKILHVIQYVYSFATREGPLG